MSTFTAQIKAFAEKSQEKIEAVVKQSAQEVLSIASETGPSNAVKPKKNLGAGGTGRMPVDTGFLRGSMIAELNGAVVAGGDGAFALAVGSMDLGDVIFAGWTANYARHVEYGTSKMAGAFFVLNAAQQWQDIVARNAEMLRNL